MQKLFDQFAFNTNPGPFHQSNDALPLDPPQKYPVRLIAYYLPQFHSIPENDAFWGVGFTEWTNVTKTLPRYIGHYQPKLPGDLGFYNLSNVDVLRHQADLSRRAGIYGFCIHDYWFSGKKVLDTPLKLILENPDIDLRFCLNWANESWSRRWDGSENDILLLQRYDSDDDVNYANSILSAVKDPRYICIDGRPLIMIYRPGIIPEVTRFVERWRSFFINNGAGDPYLVMPQAFGDNDPRKFGLDAAAGFPPHNGGLDIRNDRNFVKLLDPLYEGMVASFESLAEVHKSNRPNEFPFFPGVCPGWDNEARKIGRGLSFYGADPATYGNWLAAAADQAKAARVADERIVFINAWNEWAEGAYLEPDRHFGFAYLAETRRVFESLISENRVDTPAIETTISSAMKTRVSRRNFSLQNWLKMFSHRVARAILRRIGRH
jgi:lipopolysaccharide biosynthesis protein